MRKILLLVFALILTVYAETLFEIKDTIGQSVFEISDDGLAVLNQGDTMMVISTSEARINLDNSNKALSRSFAVTTSATGKAGEKVDVLEITTNNAKMREGGNGNEYTDFSPENIFVGLNAGWQTQPDTTHENTGQRNVFIGNNAGFSNITGYDNIFVGTNSGYSISNGTSNTALGVRSLNSNTFGGQNTSIGYESLKANIGGSLNTALGMWAMMNSESGNYNTCVGMYSGYGNKVGGYNTSIGYKSYDSGFNSGGAHTYCTFLGYDADISGVNTYSNCTVIGNGSRIDASDQVRVGNSSVTSIGGYVGWTTLGQKEYTKNVSEDIVGLNFINKLRPVSYYLDVERINNDLDVETSEETANRSVSKSSGLKRSGLIPEEVWRAAEESDYDFTGIDISENKEGQSGIRYSELVIPLIKAVQEQQELIEKLESRISELEKK